MDSSRSTTIGITLIMLIFLGWFLLNQPKSRPPAKVVTTGDTAKSGAAARNADASTPPSGAQSAAPVSAPASSSVFLPTQEPSVERAHVSTPLFDAEISTKGGAISSWILKSYKRWDKGPLELVNLADYHGGDVNLKFVASDGKNVDTKDLAFVVDTADLRLGDSDNTVVKAYYQLDSTRRIEKTFRFNGSKYTVEIEYHLVGMENAIAGYQGQALVENPLPYVEQRPEDEAASSLAFAGMKNSTPEELDVKKPEEPQLKTYNGDVDFVAARSQYFIESMIPHAPTATGAQLKAEAYKAGDDVILKRFAVGVNVPLLHKNDEHVTVTFYLGPLEYKRVEAMGVGLDNTMNFGYRIIGVRWISINIMLPLLLWLHGFISNWGVVIIVFSILIKFLTVPLSTGQMKSMRKMRVLQPKVTEVREKFKDDPKKMNEEMMALYRTYGVNPAGGCLPMLLQMPILFSLWAVLRNVIELRQAPFFSWIHDLSVPDGLIQLGTKIPILGNQLSGLTLLLGAAMVVQQIFTVTDPRQKSMAYLMPIIFTFMFNKLPSGVALYYLMFNLFGLGQQFYITKIAAPIDLESMKADPKKAKSGGLMAKLQEMEKNAREVRTEQYTKQAKKKR
jgi:YidC/Oxa1 family membrane protein insertase